MKSQQLTGLFDPKDFSDLQVMESRAGYYVGSSYKDGTPGTRDSSYHPTQEAAEHTLGLYLTGQAQPRRQP